MEFIVFPLVLPDSIGHSHGTLSKPCNTYQYANPTNVTTGAVNFLRSVWWIHFLPYNQCFKLCLRIRAFLYLFLYFPVYTLSLSLSLSFSFPIIIGFVSDSYVSDAKTILGRPPQICPWQATLSPPLLILPNSRFYHYHFAATISTTLPSLPLPSFYHSLATITIPS